MYGSDAVVGACRCLLASETVIAVVVFGSALVLEVTDQCCASARMLGFTGLGGVRVRAGRVLGENGRQLSSVVRVETQEQMGAHAPEESRFALPVGNGKVEEASQALSRFIRQCKRVVCLTGAGLSTASGIPDYRSPDGAYSKGNELSSRKLEKEPLGQLNAILCLSWSI